MSGSEPFRNGGDDPSSPPVPKHPTPPRQSHHTPTLHLAIVDQDERPDRATVHPPGLTGTARLETWLSVDLSVVVELSAWR